MISVEEAKLFVANNTFLLAPVNKNISETLNFMLAEPISSPISYPPFDQSAMDGFAIRFADFRKSVPIEIIGESSAGKPFAGEIKEGQSVRVLTGSKIPSGADTVVVQEKISEESGKLIISDPSLEMGSNIRSMASQIKEGDEVLLKGHLITPATIGLLASLGISSVMVFSNPRVSIIVTGNELCKPEGALPEGQVYESNSFCLKAALESINIKSTEIIFLDDDEKQTIEKLKTAIEKSDVVLTTGGISIGKYDYVGKALKQIGVQTVFYKVSQKPGKPLFFGKMNSCLIFGLPGNPAAALSCFYEYSYPALRKMQGHQNLFLKKEWMPIATGTKKKKGLALFLKGKTITDKVTVLEGQESSNMSSFATADCLIYLSAQQDNITPGEKVEVHFLP